MYLSLSTVFLISLLYGIEFSVCQLPLRRFKSDSQSFVQNNLSDDVFEPPREYQRHTFDWNLSKKICEDNLNSNIIISPTSIKILLTLLYEGAAGNTVKELRDVLELEEEPQVLREQIQKLIQSYRVYNPDYELLMSSRLFIDDHFSPKQRYAAQLENFYYTGIEKLNFSANVREAKEVINKWVKEATKGRVDGFLREDDVRNALLIMMNTIYFKGKWRYIFQSNETFLGQFNINSRQKVPATYMTNKALYYYTDSLELDAKILRLPYQGKRFAMYIFLPNAKNGLNELINRITPQIFQKHLWKMDLSKVEVIIPKIKYEFTARLGPILEQLGLTEIFQSTVSLAGIARGQNGGIPNLIVTNVIQKSGIDIYEEGTEAYSVTTITLGNKFNAADYIFNASHPFLFIIEDERNHNILYFGKIVNPLQTIGEVNTEGKWQPLSKPTAPGVQPPLGPFSAPADQNTAFLNPNNNEASTQALERTNYFDIDLLQTMAKNRNGNVLVSPIIVKLLLAMILEGANGETAREIQSILRLPESLEVSRTHVRNLLAAIETTKNPDIQLKLASALFHSRLVPIHYNYRSLIQNYYNSEINTLDFTDKQSAIKVLNNWISVATNGAIKQIVDDIDPQTLITLVNGIYFKSDWLKQFSRRDTLERCFHVTESLCEKVQMMHMKDTYLYADILELDAQAVNIPYKNNSFSMLILVPNKRTGIDQLVRDLPHRSLSTIIKSLKETEIKLSIPKFSLSLSQNLVADLDSLGIHKLFTNADLSGMTTGNTPLALKVDSLIHKVMLEVNEEGSIAAASNAAMIIPLISSSEPVVRAEHPFLLFIMANGNILFEGRISNPNK